MPVVKRRKPKSVYKTKKYKAWRKKVYRRDGFQCQMCKAPKGRYIEAHHILPKSKYPRLIYKVANGITLCKPCHVSVTGNELKYVKFFRKLLRLRKKKAVEENKNETW